MFVLYFAQVGNSRRRSVHLDQMTEEEKRKEAEKVGSGTVVDLSRRNLTRIPLEAYLLLGPFVNRLKISRNRITEVPDQLGRWSTLQMLSLDYNQVRALPRTFGVHVGASLRELNASNNALSKLPDSFRLLTSLTTLLLSGNSFSSVPPQISSCLALRKLALRSCNISEAAALGTLTNLTSLALNKNPPLVALPIELGCCTALTTLEFDPVSFPPQEIWSVGHWHLMAHLALFLGARDTHSAVLPHLSLASLAAPVCW